MKRILSWIFALVIGGGTSVLIAQYSTGTGSNLRVRADSNGALTITSPVDCTATLGPLTPFANLTLKADSNGALLTCGGGSGGGTDATITFTDITTNNATINKHGFLLKLSGDANDCLLGDGTWGACAGGGSGAPASAHYLTSTAEAGLSAEVNLGALTTGLTLNTVTAGVAAITTYAGTSCTNQFPRSLSASAAATCASVANADLAGSIAASKLVGTDIATVGTITSGTWNGTALDVQRAGTGITSYTKGNLLVASASATLSKLAVGADGTCLTADSGTLTGLAWATCASGGGGSVSDTAFGVGWDASTTVAPSQNAVYDLIQTFCTISDPGANRFIGWDDTDNACAAFTIGSGLTYTHGTHTITADVTLGNAVVLENKTINGAANSLTVLAASQLSGFVPIGNICTATNADSSHFLRGDCTWQTIAGGGDALVANPLSQFASTTSAELAGVITNETGTSLLVYNTTPTLVTPIITGNRWAFAAKTADYTVLGTDSILSCNAAGSSVTVTFTLPTAASVSGKAYTFVRIDSDVDGNCVLDGNSSETIDGAATYSMPFGTATSIVSDGTNWIVTGSSGQALSDPSANKLVYWNNTAKTLDFNPVTITSAGVVTNLSFDAEGSGNTLTIPVKWMFNTGIDQGGTASLGLSCLTALCPTATALTGTNVAKAWARFPDSDGAFEVQGELLLPADWTGALDIGGVWRTAATSGDIKLYVTVACSADAEIFNDTWVAAGNVVETAKGTTLQLNTWGITGLTTTGCAAGELMHWRVYRSRADAADSLTGTWDLGPITFTARRAM